MATSQQTLAPDNTTVTTFKAWAKAISDVLASFGWVQQNDTGQVVWTATVLTLTQVAAGATAVYSYSSFTGPAPRVGMSVIITGFATGGNNVTATLTAVSGGASGTVTVALTTQANETHAGSGTTTAIAAVPASTYVYEIWSPGDGGTAFYLKMEYGFSTTVCQMRFSVGTSTNGAGGLTGTTLGTYAPSTSGGNSASTAECDFSGDSGRFGMMLFRNAGANVQCLMAIERTRDSSGAVTNDGVTIWTIQYHGNSISAQCVQSTIVFGVGALSGFSGGLILDDGLNATGAQFGNVPLYPCFPFGGKMYNPATVIAFMHKQDVLEGATVTASQYGSTRTYIASQASSYGFGDRGHSAGSTIVYSVLLRYD